MTTPPTLQSLPLFPLGSVLFPGGVLPLRIFEVRYLDMMGKCLKAGAPFGVVTLTQGAEVRRPGAPAEAFYPLGTLATIVHAETPQAGLMMVRCAGAQRFRIQRSEQLRHGLWVGDVECMADDMPVPVPADLQVAADALGTVLDRLRNERQLPPEQMPVQEPFRLDDCGWVANRWCELLPVSLELKHRLMSLDSPLMRLELVNDVLARTGIAKG